MIDNAGLIVANGTNPLIFSLGGTAPAGLLANSGGLQVNDGSTMQFRSSGVTISNEGLISLNALNGTSTLSFDDSGTGALFSITNTAAGSGKITLSDNSGNRIVGVNGTESLFLGPGQQLSGAGTIGNFSLLDNHGTITANGTNALIIGLSNTANMENHGVVNVSDGSTMQFRSSGITVDNEGLIALNAAKGTSTLSFDDSGTGALFSITNTAAGGGKITLSDNSGNRIVGVNGTESLFLGGGQQVSGAGTIGNFSFIDNHGTITANGTNPLIISLSSTANPFGNLENAGVINVSDGSTVMINSGAWINNTGSISLNAGAHTSTLAFNNTQPVLLGSATNAGQVIMSDNPGNRIVGRHRGGNSHQQYGPYYSGRRDHRKFWRRFCEQRSRGRKRRKSPSNGHQRRDCSRQCRCDQRRSHRGRERRHAPGSVGFRRYCAYHRYGRDFPGFRRQREPVR